MACTCRRWGAGGRLLARRALFANGAGQAGGEQRAPGELREGLGGAFDSALGAMGRPWDGPRTSRGGHERFELTFFSVFGGHRAL